MVGLTGGSKELKTKKLNAIETLKLRKDRTEVLPERQVHQHERGLYLVEDVVANDDKTIPFQD